MFTRVKKIAKGVSRFSSRLYEDKLSRFVKSHNVNIAQKNVFQKMESTTSYAPTNIPIQEEYLKNNSYAQCGEDRIIYFLLQLTYLKNEFTYLDIGANHPVNGNNTNLFYQMGFRGILVEPNKNLADMITVSRPGDIVLNAGIGFKEETELSEFYLFKDYQLSTFSKTKAESLKKCGQELIDTQLIELHSINKIIDEYSKGHVSFINLDAEGMDFKILQSIDFDLYKPDIICIENTDVDTSLDIEKKIEMSYQKSQSRQITAFMENKGYFQYANNFVNSIFISKKLLKNFLEIVI